MRKLADISAFETLQNQSSSAVSDLSVFNVSDIQLIRYIKEGWEDGAIDAGISDAANAFVDDLIAEHPEFKTWEEFEDRLYAKAEELNEKIRKSWKLEGLMYSTRTADGRDSVYEDGEPGDDTFLSWGGVDGVCDAFAEIARWYLEERLAGKDTSYENVIARKMGFA